MKLKCPRCVSKDLTLFVHEKVEFDFCSPGCRGVWADQGELSVYIETKNDLPSKRDIQKEGKPTALNCPKCSGQKLLELSYLTGKETLIDICPKCSGIWMDGKELAAIQKLAVKVDANGKFARIWSEMKKKGY